VLCERRDAAVAAQGSRGDGKILERRQLEGHVAGMTGDGREQIRVAHGQHQRAEAARRLAADGARLRRGDGPIAGIDRGDHLTREVRLVISERRRIEVLRAPPAGEAVGRDDDHLAHRAAADEAIEPRAQPRLPGVPRKQHLAGARVAGQPGDDRVAPR
jgi:hypothetical protein